MQINIHGQSKNISSKYTQQPVIGIMTQPLEDDDKYQPANWTRITTRFVKYVESAGAIAVPIYYNHTREGIKNLMHKINGVLFTGGGQDFFDNGTIHYPDYSGSSYFFDPETGNYTDYFRVSGYIYDEAIEMNENGIHFPIWGT